ncbi:acyltransferase family protein [Salinibacterium soli]|uniref:Acyltransferase n=1 Tax=Antiquaquibacter soli TaxID=3064523 RepID=A0ABT9BN39_9MICO|nr:acyltransferase [Protaetiibacter sp. WY-16]MDO7881201.1 acyltransferase [Protaetiibacter sp. WY-16]
MTDAIVGTRKRLDLQALRALAVIAVVLNHSWPGLAPGGYLGVDIFFVVSGFLITQQLVRESEREGRIRLRRFYLRRARRLLPAATIVLVAVSLLTIAVIPERQWGAVFQQIAGSALYVQNWVLLLPGHGPDVDTPVRHFWSLSVEEQFYLVWPLLIIAGVALAARAALRQRAVLLAGGGVLAAASLIYWIAASSADYQLAYFSSLSRAWEFAVGGMLALIPGLRLRGRWADALFWAGLVVVLASIALFTDNPGPWSTLPVAGTLAMIAAANERVPASVEWLVAWRPVQFTGDISYALYLWHWPVLLFAPYITGVPSETWVMALLLAGAVVLSWATTRFVENPVRRVPLEGERFQPRRRLVTLAVGSGLALTIGISAVGSAIDAKNDPRPTACLERGVQTVPTD